jgi:hypothetical protein
LRCRKRSYRLHPLILTHAPVSHDSSIDGCWIVAFS